MGRTIKVTGMDEVAKTLNELGANAHGIAAVALYEGAGHMADAIRESVNGIATEEQKSAPRDRKRLPSPEEKALLQSGAAGIAKFVKTGESVSTSVSMQRSGYGVINGKTKPIPLIANSIESGTSFMKKQPFFRKAVNKAKGSAQAKIVAKFDAEVKKITG